MNTAFWICALGLPLVGGLHRFAVSYGYAGESRATALGSAWRVATMLAFVSALFIAAKLAESN